MKTATLTMSAADARTLAESLDTLLSVIAAEIPADRREGKLAALERIADAARLAADLADPPRTAPRPHVVPVPFLGSVA